MDQSACLNVDDISPESLKLQLASKLWPYLKIEDMAKCSCVCTPWQFDFSKNEYRKLVLRKSGIQKQHRPSFWASSLHVPKVQRKIITRGDIKNARTPTMYYIEYVQHHHLPLADGEEERIQVSTTTDSSGTAALDIAGPEGEILRDVGRTFPSAALFKDAGRGQNMLANVLKACLRAEPGVGYCQGMNFVAATLLRACIEANDEKRKLISTNINTEGNTSEEGGKGGGGAAEEEDGTWSNSEEDRQAEADAFWLMMAIMDSEKKMDMNGMWSSGVPALRLRCFQFESLLKVHVPRLHAHLHSIGLATEVLASQWFLTLFAYALPFESTAQCWDEVFLDGWTQILKVAIGHLKECEEKLLPLTLEDTSRFLRSWKFSGDIFSRALQIAQTIEVTPGLVEQLQVEYGVTQLRRRLAVRGPSWLQRYGDPLDVEDGREEKRDNILDSLMAELLELEGVGRSDAANLRARIESAHITVGTARTKLTKAESALARASGELGAAKQAKLAAAKAARDTIASIKPMMRASSNPTRRTSSRANTGGGVTDIHKEELEDGALAVPLSNLNFRSVSAPPVTETPSDDRQANDRQASEEVSDKRVLPRRPQRPPPTPPPTTPPIPAPPSPPSLLVPFPSLPSSSSPVSSPTTGEVERSASPSPTISGLAVLVEDFLFGRDLDTQRALAPETGKKSRSDSFNSALKLPSLSFNLDLSPLHTLAYAVSSPHGAVGSEQRLMSDLRAQQKAALSAERKVVAARSKYAVCLRKFKVAQADLEDAVDFKKRLSQQLLHILTMSEDEQFSKMLTMSSIFDTNATPDAVTVTLVQSEEYSV